MNSVTISLHCFNICIFPDSNNDSDFNPNSHFEAHGKLVGDSFNPIPIDADMKIIFASETEGSSGDLSRNPFTITVTLTNNFIRGPAYSLVKEIFKVEGIISTRNKYNITSIKFYSRQ